MQKFQIICRGIYSGFPPLRGENEIKSSETGKRNQKKKRKRKGRKKEKKLVICLVKGKRIELILFPV